MWKIFSRRGSSDLSQRGHSWEEEFNCCVMGFHTYREKSGKRGFRSVAFGPFSNLALLDMHDVFFGMSDSLMLYKKIVDSKVSLRMAQGYVKHNMYRSLAQSSLGYICYDLAAQFPGEIGSSYGACTASEVLCCTTERLMRFLALSFANILSCAQRRAVLSALDIAKQEEVDAASFLELLRVIDRLALYLYPDRRDSEFVSTVDEVVKSLLASFSGSSKEIQAEGGGVLILALEAAFLENAASDALSHIIRRTDMNKSLRKQCAECMKRITASEKELYDVAVKVLDNIVGSWHDSAETSEFEISSYCYDYTSNCESVDVVGGMESILSQAKEITKTCERLFVDLKKGKVVNGSTGSECSHGSSGYSSMSSASSRSSLSSGGVSLKCGEGSRKALDVDGVLSGSLDEYQLMSRWVKDEDIGCTSRYNRKLCVGVVASLAKKCVDDFCVRDSSRIRGDVEIKSTAAAYKMFQSAVASTNDNEVVDCMSGGYSALLGAILLNLACGDVSRVTGGTQILANSRLLTLYVHMLCNLPPTLMKKELLGAESSFSEYGKELPAGVYDMICLLIDVKRASSKLGFTECEESSVRSADYGSFVRKVTCILAKVLGYYSFCHGGEAKKGISGSCNDVRSRIMWLDVA